MTKYPIYVPSKARWDTRQTIKALERDGLPYRVVIQPQDHDRYAEVVDAANILTLPFDDNHSGLLRARNWIWEHAISEGHKRHWQLDDNINGMVRWDGRKRKRTNMMEAIAAMEQFVDRYENVGLAGPAYRFACGSIPNPRKAASAPFELNTRIYSFTLILNSLPFRYRARYNDDTDLSLQVLKAGWCSILFLVYLCNKAATMTLKGGNTDHLYAQTEQFDGRLEMAKSLVRQHPDVTKITRKWGRWQHHVDYRPFRANKLKLKDAGKQAELINGRT